MSLRVLENVELVGSQLNAKLGIFFLEVLNKDELELRYSQRVASSLINVAGGRARAPALPSEGSDKPSFLLNPWTTACMHVGSVPWSSTSIDQ